MKAIVHNIIKNGPIAENKENDPFFKERLFGDLGFACMIEPDFALPLKESLKKVDWGPYNQAIEPSRESEICNKSLSRVSHFNRIEFDELGFFKDIETISQQSHKELIKQLNELKEKCKSHPTADECRECIYVKEDLYKICMKYILGHYVGNTGGPHHGHELFDIGGQTDYKRRQVYVSFLGKSGRMNRESKDSLIRQFLHNTDLSELDVISIVSPENLDHQLELDIRRIYRLSVNKKYICLIMRDEMGRILHSFNSSSFHSEKL